jgi:hypothetical protein
LSFSMPKACEICRAIRTQPNFGLRHFSSMIAAMTSGDGPFGPSLHRLAVDEKRKQMAA